MLGGPRQRDPQVVVLGLQPVEPVGALRRHQQRARARPDSRASRTAARRQTAGPVAAGVEQLAGQLAHDLQRREPLRSRPRRAGPAPGRPARSRRRADRRRRARGATSSRASRRRPAGEDGERGEHPAGRLVEQVVAPQQRAAQGLLARAAGRGDRCAAAPSWEPRRSAISRGVRVPTRDAASSTASGSRPTPSTIRVDRLPVGRPERQVGSHRARPLGELLDRGVPGRAAPRGTAAPRAAAAGCARWPARVGPAAPHEQPRDHLRAVAELLDVVEDQQHPPAAEVVGEPGHPLGAGVGGRRQRAAPGRSRRARGRASRTSARGTKATPSGKSPRSSSARCSARRVLPTPPGPVQGDQPVRGQQLRDPGGVGVAADDRRRRAGRS